MSGLEFFVPGRPAPQGSKRHIGNGRMLESSREVGPWRERIAIAAHNAMKGQPPRTDAVTVQLTFTLPWPKSAPKRYMPAVKRPDIDKLARAVLDALTHVVFVDDSQVVGLRAVKRLTEPDEMPGVRVHVRGDS